MWIAGELLSRLLFYGTFIALCIMSDWIWMTLGVFGFIIFIKALVVKLGMARLNEKYLLLPSLILDPIMPVLLVAIRISGYFVSNNQTWK